MWQKKKGSKVKLVRDVVWLNANDMARLDPTVKMTLPPTLKKEAINDMTW